MHCSKVNGEKGSFVEFKKNYVAILKCFLILFNINYICLIKQFLMNYYPLKFA